MTSHSVDFARPALRWASRLSLFSMLYLNLGLVGCYKGYHASVDSRLRAIQEMVETNLPENTSRARVELFLRSRGYESEAAPNP